jgi:hypothetical protein
MFGEIGVNLMNSPDFSPVKDGSGPEEPPSYFVRGSSVVAAALLSATFLLLSYWPLWHSDIWGHLKYGQWIVQHRRLPEKELFLSPEDRQPYIGFYWLMQAGTYAVFSLGERLAGGDELHRLAGGAELLAALYAALSLLSCFLQLLAYRRISGSLPLACVGLVLAVMCVSRVQRPQVAGEVCFAAVLWSLSGPMLSRRALILVPLCLALWANLHGSYAAGLVLIGLFFVGRLIEVGRASGSWRWTTLTGDTQIRRLLLVGLFSTVAVSLLNPQGPRLLLDTLLFSRFPNVPAMDEWNPLSFRWGFGDHWLYIGTIILVIAAQIVSPRLLSPTALLLCISFGVMPLKSQRMLIWWYMLVPWIVLPAWAELGRSLKWPWLHYRSEATGGKTLMAVSFIFLAVWLSPSVRWLRSGQPRPLERTLGLGTPWQLAAQLTSPDGKSYYPDLAKALNDYPNHRFQGAIFTTLTQGEYLLWALPSEYPVSLYTHVHLFSEKYFRDCLNVLTVEPGWRGMLDRQGVNMVVVEVEDHPQITAALKADPEWVIVVDETGLRSKPDPRTRLLVAVRKTPISLSLIEPW